jgi:hypothetical protein
MRLSELKIGDKFWFGDRPYLVIDLDFKNLSYYEDFSNMKCVLDLNTYKVLGFSTDTKVIQERDNIPV